MQRGWSAIAVNARRGDVRYLGAELPKSEEIFARERQLASQANGHGILKYSLSPLENGAVVEGTRDGGRSALVIDNYACAALVCLCRDPPAARTGALYFANPLLALLNSRPAAWCPQHRSLQHIRCRWAVPYSSTGILGQHGQVGRPGTATHHAGGALLHACSAHGAGVYMCVRVGCAWHAEAKCAVECCY